MCCRRSDDGWKLLVIANDRDMHRLVVSADVQRYQGKVRCSRHTPLDSGSQDRGSVAILASSRKTIGKSITSRSALTELRHVAHICALAFARIHYGFE